MASDHRLSEHELKQLFDRHKNAVYRFAWRLTHSPVTAEDITQDVFMALLRAPKKERTPEAQRTYLLGIARNLALKHWRNANRWAALPDDSSGSYKDLPIIEPLSLDHLDASHAVGTAMAMLSPLQKEVLILSAYEGLSLKEIGEITNSTVTTVKARLFRAQDNMKRMLAPLQPVAVRSLK